MDEYTFHYEADFLIDDGYQIHAKDISREQLDQIRDSYYRLKHNSNVLWWFAWITANLFPLFFLKAQFPYEFLTSNGAIWSYIGMGYMFVSGLMIYAIIKRNLRMTIQDTIDITRAGNAKKRKVKTLGGEKQK